MIAAFSDLLAMPAIPTPICCPPGAVPAWIGRGFRRILLIMSVAGLWPVGPGKPGLVVCGVPNGCGATTGCGVPNGCGTPPAGKFGCAGTGCGFAGLGMKGAGCGTPCVGVGCAPMYWPPPTYGCEPPT